MKAFKKTVWEFYKKNKRDLPWRKTFDPYHILVSEIMLQQTQVSRVLIKYPVFIKQFPHFKQLASAPTKDVLQAWAGMGYNRRALYLKRIAETVERQYKGILPDNPVILDLLPGIGAATAASVVAFAFNKPTVFIETNIRRVFIHHFFTLPSQVGRRESYPAEVPTCRDEGGSKIDDREIFPLVQKTLDVKNPREWYWALMDYGSYLSKVIDNPNKKSKHYSLQSSFEGSDRQIRGEILRLLLKRSYSEKELAVITNKDSSIFSKILQDLIREQFIQLKGKKYRVNN